MMTLHLIKFICFINYYNNYMPISVPTVFYELNYRRKKEKTHTCKGIVKNKCTKPTKEWLDVAIWLNI